jgi:[acyl-carrier-protein] S-malonyltransferase
VTVAFLFAGQGVEPPWVARDLLAEPAVAELVALAGDEAGVDLARLLLRGGRDLSRPEVVQPALVAVSLGALRVLASAGVRPHLAAGHSLGELSAWAACECVAAEDAVRAAALRGRLMAREASRHPGGMLALTGATRETCLEAVALGAGSVCIAAHNAPDEWVLSGDLAALSRIAARFRAVRLAVAGAWHSPAMAGAVSELGAALARIPRRPGRARWVANRDGQVADDERIIPELLAGQLVRPIRWVAALRTLEASGCRRLVAVGPGKVLRALVRRSLGAGVAVEMVESLRDVERAAA